MNSYKKLVLFLSVLIVIPVVFALPYLQEVNWGVKTPYKAGDPNPSPNTQINLQPGANLVSFGVWPVTISATDCDRNTFWYYDVNSRARKNAGSSVVGTMLNAEYNWGANSNLMTGGYGFWIRSTKSCTIDFAGPNPSSLVGKKLNSNWNLIGAPWSEKSDAAFDINRLKGNCQILSGPWWYDPGQRKYVYAQTLQAGKGYFIRVSADCQLFTGCYDLDNDGYPTYYEYNENLWADPNTHPDFLKCRPADCNDNNPNIYPGARELCNGHDDNCNQYEADAPYGPTILKPGTSGDAPSDYIRIGQRGVDEGGGCDSCAAVEETCNDIDDNCDGVVDNIWGNRDGLSCPIDCKENDCSGNICGGTFLQGSNQVSQNAYYGQCAEASRCEFFLGGCSCSFVDNSRCSLAGTGTPATEFRLTALSADPLSVIPLETVTLSGTGGSPSGSVKLICGIRPGTSNVCSSVEFVPSNPSCSRTVSLAIQARTYTVYCRMQDSSGAVSNEMQTLVTVE